MLFATTRYRDQKEITVQSCMFKGIIIASIYYGHSFSKNDTHFRSPHPAGHIYNALSVLSSVNLSSEKPRSAEDDIYKQNRLSSVFQIPILADEDGSTHHGHQKHQGGENRRKGYGRSVSLRSRVDRDSDRQGKTASRSLARPSPVAVVVALAPESRAPRACLPPILQSCSRLPGRRSRSWLNAQCKSAGHPPPCHARSILASHRSETRGLHSSRDVVVNCSARSILLALQGKNMAMDGRGRDHGRQHTVYG